MSSVSEWIVREYFESLGYLVTQPCKYSVTGKKKSPDEHIDLIIHKPAVTGQVIPNHLVWKTADLNRISCAIIGVSGCHTERFYPTTFEYVPDLFKFTDAKTLKSITQKIGLKNPAKILCLPHLPVSEKLKNESIELLRSHGVDGVLSFHTLLLELVRMVSTNRNYEKSDLLQIIRLLKNYDLLKNEQMELFTRKTRKRP